MAISFKRVERRAAVKPSEKNCQLLNERADPLEQVLKTGYERKENVEIS